MIITCHNDSIANRDAFCIWAEPEAGDRFLGLCLSVAKDRVTALEDARATLLAGIKQIDDQLMEELTKPAKTKSE